MWCYPLSSSNEIIKKKNDRSIAAGKIVEKVQKKFDRYPSNFR